ncbi:hypothetical protein JCM5353_005326 [Sporobolomyces roseus]
MSKRPNPSLPNPPPAKRKTRSSGPPEEAPPLSTTTTRHFFKAIAIEYKPSRLHLRRKAQDPSLQSQTVSFAISTQLSKNDKERNIIFQRIKSKVKERIAMVEESEDPRALTQAEYETIVSEVGEEEGLGAGEGRRSGNVPHLSGNTGGESVWIVNAKPDWQVTVRATDFEMDVLTDRRLEELVPVRYRSLSFKRAIDSNNVELRTMSYLTTRACLTADSLHPRTDSLWNETFLLELNKYRKPLRRIAYHDHVKVARYEHAGTISMHCNLYQGASFSKRVWFASQVGIRSAELNQIFEGFLVLQESEELTWEEVNKVHKKWRDEMASPVGMSPDEALRVQSTAETSAMSARVFESVRTATIREDQYRGATDKQVKTLGKYIVKKFVSLEERKSGRATRVKMQVIKNCLTGEPLLSLPASATVREVRDLVSKSTGIVSMDHLEQMVPGLANGSLLPVMNSELNLAPVSPIMNEFKYRWNGSQLGFMFVGMSISEGTTGVVAENTGLLKAHSRLLKLSKAAYAAHRMPCPRYLRGTLPISRIKDVMVVNASILELLGLKFAVPLPTFLDYLEHIGISSEDFDDSATQELQRMSDQEYVETGLQLDIDAQWPVRPGTNLNHAVSPAFESGIHQVSNSLDSEFKNKYNMIFNKTREGEGAGIIAVTSNGTENVQDICRFLLKFRRKALKELLGIRDQDPWITLYANSICFVAHEILTKRKYQKFDEPTKVFFHDPINPGLALDLPPDSKHPLMPSICSNDHPKHLHGWIYKSPKIEDLTFEGWSTSRNTMRLATYASNMGDGKGDAAWIKKDRDSLRKSIRYFRSDVETGFDKLVKRFLDPSPTGDAFIDKVFVGIKSLDADYSIAPPPSAAARAKRTKKEKEMARDQGN